MILLVNKLLTAPPGLESEDIMKHTEGKLIAMQNNLGLGHKGDILITAQERIDNNLPALAKDIIDEVFARRICLCVNSHNELVEACKLGLKLAQMLNHPDEYHINQAIINATETPE
jgi:hypothetical protein